jgi:hypothetical protein
VITIDIEDFELLEAMTFEEWLDYYRRQPGGWLVAVMQIEALRVAYEHRLDLFREEENEEN